MSEFDSGLCDEKHKTINEKLDESMKRLEQHDNSIAELRQLNVRLTAIVELLTDPERNKKFWETPTGQKVIWYLMLVSLAIIGTALGVNLLGYFK